MRTDAGLLRRAIDNMLHNAVRFTPAEGGVELATRSTGDAILISVRDRGRGVPESDLLGLAITQRIMALLGDGPKRHSFDGG